MTQRLPTERKQLSGTYKPSKDRKGIDAGAALADVPVPPETISAPGAKEWARLAPLLVDMGLLTEADLRTLELLCETLATATELEAAIKLEGFTIEAATGGRKAHPALKALETTRNAASRMLGDFGLSPKARKYVSKAPAAKDRDWNPWEHLED